MYRIRFGGGDVETRKNHARSIAQRAARVAEETWSHKLKRCAHEVEVVAAMCARTGAETDFVAMLYAAQLLIEKGREEQDAQRAHVQARA